MKGKIETKKIRNLGVFVVISLILAVFTAQPCTAENPLAELDTKVSVNDAGDGYIYWQEDSNEAMRLTGNQLGIGTATPGATLDVDPVITTTSDYIGIRSDMEFDPTTGTMTNWYGVYVAAPLITSGSITNKYAFVTESDAGSVGIGTTGPDAKLDILDTSGAQLRLTHTNEEKFCDFQVDANHDLTINPSSNGQIKLQSTTDSTDFFQVWNAAQTTPVLNVDTANDRVGIGTTTPTYQLDVVGSAKISGSLVVDAVLNVDSGTLFVENDFNKVGIGTTTPAVAAGLDVRLAVTASGGSAKGSTFQQTLNAVNTLDKLTAVYIKPTYNDGPYGDIRHCALKVEVPNNYGGAAELGSSGVSATGDNAVAMGDWTSAMGKGSTAMGYFNSAKGDYSVVMGLGFNEAIGDGAFATGGFSKANGYVSTAIGWQAEALGSMSTAIGRCITAGPTGYTHVIGVGYDDSYRIVNNIGYSLMVGYNSDKPTLFVGPSSGPGTWGKVGIGTTSPTAQAHIVRYSGPDAFRVDDVVSDLTPFVIDQDGDVGIGTPSPNGLLELSKTSGDPDLKFDIGGTDKWTIGVDDSDGDKFKIGTSGIDTDTRLTIDDQGNVGISVSNPKAKFHSTASTIIGADTSSVSGNDIGSGEVNIWVDETNNRLYFKVKYSSGTVIKQGYVSLS